MSRPRTPLAVAKMRGLQIKHPERFRDRTEPKVDPLGPPPDRLDADQHLAWLELADEFPWLSKSDRKLVEVAAKLTARMMTDPTMGVNALAQLRMCLQAMGGTPADRSKISAPKEDDADEGDEFLN